MHNEQQIIDTATTLNENIVWWLEKFNTCLQKVMSPNLDEDQFASVNAEFTELMGRGEAEQRMAEKYLRDWIGHKEEEDDLDCE